MQFQTFNGWRPPVIFQHVFESDNGTALIHFEIAINRDVRRNPSALVVFRGAELALRYPQLSPENLSSYYAYANQSGSKNADSSSPASHYKIAIGLLLLGASISSVFIAFKSAEYADYRWPAFWWARLIGGLAFAALIAVMLPSSRLLNLR